MCIFHKWSKWKQYDQKIVVIPRWQSGIEQRQYEATEIRQKRECLKCGYVQDEVVN